MSDPVGASDSLDPADSTGAAPAAEEPATTPTSVALALAGEPDPLSAGGILIASYECEPFDGMLTVLFTAEQGNSLVAGQAWQFSGKDVPKTVRIALEGPSWVPSEPAKATVVVSVGTTELGRQEADVAPAAA